MYKEYLPLPQAKWTLNTGLPSSLRTVQIAYGDFGNPENFSSDLSKHIRLKGFKMDPVFAALWRDFAVAAALGAVGGFGLGLLQEKGLEMPHWYKETGVRFADFGFLADILIGALAAVIIYALNQPTGILQLIFATITAGIGGSAILKGYIKGTAAREQASLAEMYRAVATDASRGVDVNIVKDRLDDLDKADKLVKRRWGPR